MSNTAEAVSTVETPTRHYSMWAVFSVGALPAGDSAATAAAIESAVAETGTAVRGYYDLTGYRAEADLMAWFRADSPEKLQAAYRALTLSDLPIEPVWSIISMFLPFEFNKEHMPGFMMHEEAPKYAAVYPFIRSYDWYLLEPKERGMIMRDHAGAGEGFDDIITSTMATFALSDYEWVVSVEGDRLDRLVELMYRFRNTKARLHVREDTPFFTGVRTELADFIDRQTLRA